MRGPRSLKVQILGTFLAIVGLVSGVGLLVLYVGEQRVLEEWVVRSNRFLARAVKRHLDRQLTQGTQAAHALAARIAGMPPDSKEISRLIEDFLHFGELFSNGYLFRPDGSLSAFAYRTPAPAGRRAKLGENYHGYGGPFAAVADGVLARGHPVFTPVFYSASGRPQITYVVPIAGPGGRPIGLLSLAVFALSEQINGCIQGLEPGKQGYLAILDANGRILALTGRPPKALESATREPLADFAGLGDREVGRLELGGVDDLLIQEKLGRAGLRVWVGLPRAVAYAPLGDLRLPALLAFGVALVLALCGGLYLTRRILRPVLDLVGGIRRVGEGVLAHRIPDERADELGEAARAFNTMTERLHRDQLIDEVWRGGEPAQRASGSRAEGPGFNNSGSAAALTQLPHDESAGAAGEPGGQAGSSRSAPGEDQSARTPDEPKP